MQQFPGLHVKLSSQAPGGTTAQNALAGGRLAETARLPLVGGVLGAPATAVGAVLAETGTPIGLLVVGLVLLVIGDAVMLRRRHSF